MVAASPASDPRIADLVRANRLRAALFLPQYRKDPVSGELQGVWVEVVRALAAHIGIALDVVELPTPARMFECLAAGGCDIASLGFDPSRADQVEGFTPPFMRVDYSFLVPGTSAIRSLVEADQPGVRIAAVRDHASTLALARVVRHVALVDAETPDAAFELLRSGRVEAWASIRPTLLHYSAGLPGTRVIAGSYGANFPALVVPKGQPGRLAYVSEFVKHAKASGLIQQAIDRAGQPGYQVVSAGDTS
jgi:polar amino acid transport system substrate-binding protein